MAGRLRAGGGPGHGRVAFKAYILQVFRSMNSSQAGSMPYAFASPECFSMIASRPSMTFNRPPARVRFSGSSAMAHHVLLPVTVQARRPSLALWRRAKFFEPILKLLANLAHGGASFLEVAGGA